MALPNNLRAQPAAATAKRLCRTSPEQDEELRRAAKDFESGDYIELSAEQLDRCIATGESPWVDESRR